MKNVTKFLKAIFQLSIAAFTLYSVIFPTHIAQAATLSISPANGSYSVGKTFSVSILASSRDSFNAASGKITYPTDKLDVVSISKSGSIISLWAEEPTDEGGAVVFQGVIMNPGYSGTGKLLTITFKTKSEGTASLKYASASILANDGNGTEIFSGSGSANFTIQNSTSQPTSEPKTDPTAKLTTDLPTPPSINSPNCPDPQKWCKDNNPTFAWSLPRGVNGVSLAITQNPNSNPGTISDGLFNSRTYTNITDGTWYFHLRLRNSTGWGDTAHFKIQIDSQKPATFSIIEMPETAETELTPSFDLTATDTLSGLDYYEVQMDGAPSEIWRDDGNHVYQTKKLAAGNHNLSVKAFDKAGNFIDGSSAFAIKVIKEPLLTEYPKDLIVGDNLIIKGVTDPEETLAVWLQKGSGDPTKYTLISDNQGEFEFVSPESLGEGTYSIWATEANATGDGSRYAKVYIPVRQSDLTRISILIISVLSLTLSIVGILLLFAVMCLLGARKLNDIMLQIQEKRELTAKNIIKLCSSCEEREQSLLKKIRMLEKAGKLRKLTKEEESILKIMKKTLLNLKNNLKREETDRVESI